MSTQECLSWPLVHRFGPYDVHQSPDGPYYAHHYHHGLPSERRRVRVFRIPPPIDGQGSIGELVAEYRGVGITVMGVL